MYTLQYSEILLASPELCQPLLAGEMLFATGQDGSVNPTYEVTDIWQALKHKEQS
jgi:hypothetical protein